MPYEDIWKPIMIVLAIFIFVFFLMYAMPTVTPTIDWSSTNNMVISLLPWLIGLGVALFTLAYVIRRK